MNSSDDDLTFAGEALDPFALSRVDITIATALLDREAASSSREGQLVLALAEAHALPAAADAAIERVRARLAAAPLTPDAQGTTANEVVTPRPSAHHRVPRPISRTQNTLRALAAVLVVALLAGSFVVVLRERQGTVTHAPRWVDVSITHARTTQPLNFDLANGISYAVAQTGGIIYACSGMSLWYSRDGGATYAPFTPAPPDGTMDGMCTLDTVQGLPGVFVRNDLPDAGGHISYGEPGGAWRTLTLPGEVSSAAPTTTESLSGPGISLFSPGPPVSHLAQYAGQWLFFIAHQDISAVKAGGPGSALIATRDFGKTWIWLDAALFTKSGNYCVSFIVMQSSPATLACVTEYAQGQPPLSLGLALSTDFGLAWQSPTVAHPEAIAGAADNIIYFVQPGEQGANLLMRYDLSVGGATSGSPLATLPDWVPQQPFGTLPPISVAPDGTVYQAYVRGSTGVVTAGVDAVAPGAPEMTPITRAAPSVTLRAKGLTPTLAFGDLDGTAPALYLGVGNAQRKGAVSPLYRLALPAPVTPPQPTATVAFPTVPAPATPQPRPQCAGDPETTAAIRPGGLGALGSTLSRWGKGDGVALGTTYMGRYPDTGQGIVSVPSTQLDGRVANLTYHVDSTAHVTLAQAQAVAATILPADAHPIPNGAPPSTVSPIAYTYCSAAFWAAFPPGTPSFSYGELAVIYYLRQDGSVDTIDFGPAVIG